MADSDSHDASSCGVCSRSLEGVLDPVTQRAVSEHLAEVSEAEQRLLSLTQQSWATGWEGILAAKCPVTLQSEMGREARKSVVSGKSVSVRVDLGGRRIIKKKKKNRKKITEKT